MKCQLLVLLCCCVGLSMQKNIFGDEDKEEGPPSSINQLTSNGFLPQMQNDTWKTTDFVKSMTNPNIPVIGSIANPAIKIFYNIVFGQIICPLLETNMPFFGTIGNAIDYFSANTLFTGMCFQETITTTPKPGMMTRPTSKVPTTTPKPSANSNILNLILGLLNNGGSSSNTSPTGSSNPGSSGGGSNTGGSNTGGSNTGGSGGSNTGGSSSGPNSPNDPAVIQLAASLNIDPSSLSSVLNGLGLTPDALQQLLNWAGKTPSDIASSNPATLSSAISQLITLVINHFKGDLNTLSQLLKGCPIKSLLLALLRLGMTPTDALNMMNSASSSQQQQISDMLSGMDTTSLTPDQVYDLLQSIWGILNNGSSPATGTSSSGGLLGVLAPLLQNLLGGETGSTPLNTVLNTLNCALTNLGLGAKGAQCTPAAGQGVLYNLLGPNGGLDLLGENGIVSNLLNGLLGGGGGGSSTGSGSSTGGSTGGLGGLLSNLLGGLGK